MGKRLYEGHFSKTLKVNEQIIATWGRSLQLRQAINMPKVLEDKIEREFLCVICILKTLYIPGNLEIHAYVQVKMHTLRET